MYTYKNIRKSHEIIKEFCMKNRAEITNYQSKLAEKQGFATYSDYTKFMNELSDDEFIGNMLTGLFNEYALEYYRKVNKGKMTIEEFITEVYGKEIL
jgi:hypothetical protein